MIRTLAQENPRMGVSIRPEALNAFEYLGNGLFATLVIGAAAFVVAFGLCYAMSLACHCANGWPAANRAWLTAKSVAGLAIGILVINAILVFSETVNMAMMIGCLLLIIGILTHSLLTTPRIVREYREERAEWEQQTKRYATN